MRNSSDGFGFASLSKLEQKKFHERHAQRLENILRQAFQSFWNGDVDTTERILEAQLRWITQYRQAQQERKGMKK